MTGLSTEAILLGIQRQSRYERGPKTPLYRFRVNQSELMALGSDLGPRLRRGEDDSLVAAGFCLYAAHAFRSAHTQGAWAWETILSSLELELSVQQIYPLVERGLRYWKRDLLGDRRREYLATLVCEGGLPTSVFRQGGARLSRYFHRLLKEAEARPQTPVREIAESNELAQLLPATLRDEIVFTLAADLVEQTIALRSLVAEGSENPLAVLDAQDSAWRDRFPVPLDDEAVTSLLVDLIQQPVASMSAAFSIEMTLDLTGRRLLRRVRFDDEIPKSVLLEDLGTSDARMPGRFRLALRADSGALQPVATVTNFGDRYRLEHLALAFSLSPDDGYHLVALVAGETLGSCAIWGGEPLDPDLPWVFGGSDTKPVYLGGGSVKTRRPTAHVSLPANAAFDGDVTDIGEVAGRKVLSFQGKAQVSRDGESWSIQCGAERESFGRCVIFSSPQHIGGGTPVYLGLPSIGSVSERRLIPDDELEWRPVGTRDWHPASAAPPAGDIVVRQTTGETPIRTRLLVVPKGTTWSFEGLQDLNAGSIAIALGQGVVGSLEVRTANVSTTGSTDLSETLQVHLQAEGLPPRAIDAILHLEEGKIPLRLPFPTEWREFVDFQGNDIPDGSVVSLRELRSLRAVIQSPDTQGQFQLLARASNLIGGWRVLANISDLRSGIHEIHLTTFEPELGALLGAMDSIDSHVNLKISKVGSTDPSLGLEVGRYDGRLDKDDHEEGYLIRWDSHLDVPMDARVVCTPFTSDFSVWSPLEKVAEGQWLFRCSEHALGAYLLSCQAPNGILVRPLRVTNSDERAQPNPNLQLLDDSGAATLGAISRLPSARERAKAMDSLLHRLWEQPSDPEWKVLTAQIQTLENLPAASLDVVRSLVRHPRIVASLLFRKPQLVPLLKGSLETLPFLWSLMPIMAWVDAAKVHHTRYEQQLACLPDDVRITLPSPDEATCSRMQNVFDALVGHAPYLYLVAAMWSKLFRSEIVLSVPSPVPTSEDYKRALQRMLRRDIDIRTHPWPNTDWGPLLSEIGLEHRHLKTGNVHNARQSVLQAPEIAANCVYRDASVSEQHLLTLRQAQSFDEDWFQLSGLYHLHALLKGANLL